MIMNLTLSQIIIKDFLSHKDTRILFNTRERLLIEGISGSGKSSIADALVWVLYGKGRVDNRSMIRKGCDKAEVSLVLHDGDTSYLIERSVTKDGKTLLSVRKATGPEDDAMDLHIPVTGTKNIQAWIENELIGASYGLFVNSVCFPQGNPDSFSSMTPSTRKELLTELADTESMGETLESAKALINEKSLELNTLESEVSSKEKIIAEKTPVADSLQSISELQTILQSKKEGFEGDIVKFRKTVEEATEAKRLYAESDSRLSVILSRKQDIIRRLSALMKEEGDLKAFDISSLELGYAEAQELSKRIAEAEPLEKSLVNARIEMEMLDKNPPRIQDHSKSIVSTKTSLEEAKSKDISCPTINAPCPKLKFANEANVEFLEKSLTNLEKLQSESEKVLSEYIAKKEELSKRLIAAEDAFKASNLPALRARYGELSSMEIGFQVAKERLKRLPLIEQERDMLADDLTKMGIDADAEALTKAEYELKIPKEDITPLLRSREKDLSELTSALYDLAQKYSLAKSAMDEITKYTVEIADAKTKIATLQYDINCLKLVKDAFGTNGIIAIIADILIPALEERTNVILSKLGDFRVELDTQQESLTGDSKKEGLFISVINAQGERMDYGSFSGGERMRLDLALFEGLAGVSRCGFRVFDEAFVGLDQDTLQSFGAALMSIKESVDQVLLITHIPDAKELMERKLTVTKSGGVSNVE